MDLSDIKTHAAKASDLLKSMSNQARLMILCNLVEGERSVSELEQLLKLSQSAISQHLAILRRERIVATRRQGQNIYYSLASDEAMAILSTLYGLYCSDKISK
jgi:DNA-binding transcriptional ArsR family regulator